MLNKHLQPAALPPMNTQPAPSRLLELDVLRGLAAIAVVYCHFMSQCRELGRTTSEFRWGSYGPHLFFLISGFVIFMTLKSCKRPMDFVFSRFSRLYPLYWVGVIFSTSIILISRRTDLSISLQQFLGNLTMMQTWLRIPDIEVAYWTLGVELKFYIIMFAVLCFHQSHNIEKCSLVWLSSVLLYRVLDQFIDLPKVLATPLILDHAHLFIAGIMFYRLRQEGSTWLRHALIGAVVPFAYIAEGLEISLFSAVFVGIFYLFVFQKLKWIALPPLTFLGTISYALYLVHGSLGHAIIAHLDYQGAPLFLLLSLPTIACIGVSALLTYSFEQPLLQRLRNWYKTRSQKKHAALLQTPNGAKLSPD